MLHYGDGADDDDDDDRVAFDPARGNVAFASAADGWAFTCADLAAAGAARVGCSAAALQRATWGGWTLDTKTRRVVKVKPGAATATKKTLFVALGLDPVWKAYEAAAASDAPAALAAAATALRLDPDPVRRAAAKDGRLGARALLHEWAPLAPCVLALAAAHLPSPRAAAAARVPRLLGGPPPPSLPPALAAGVAAVETAAAACDAGEGAPLLAYVAKMVALPPSALPPRGAPADRSHAALSAAAAAAAVSTEREVFVAFVRVFAGVLRDGMTVHALSPAYEPTAAGDGGDGDDGARGDAQSAPLHTAATVDGVYLMMGRHLVRVAAAPAGALACVGGLGAAVVKAATLTSSLAARPLAPVALQAAPIVRVAVDAADPAQAPALAAGLALLHRADPLVTVEHLPSGEAVVGAAGEVHLETAVADLETRFARIKLVVSPPLAALRESVASGEEEGRAAVAAAAPAARGAPTPLPVLPPPKIAEAVTPGGAVTLRVRALPLTSAVAAALDGAAGLRPALAGARGGAADAVRARVAAAVRDGGAAAEALLARAWALGPHGAGPAALLASDGGSGDDDDGGPLWRATGDAVVKATAKAGAATAVSQAADGDAGPAPPTGVPLRLGAPRAAAALGLAPPSAPAAADATPLASLRADVEAGVSSGFQMAAAAGPLCDEPVWGVAFEVAARVAAPDARTPPPPSTIAEDVYGPLSGQVASAARAACRAALRGAHPRVVEPFLLADVAATADALAGVYAALGRRRARVLAEEMRDGDGSFAVRAALPAAAALGLASDLRARASGAASAALRLSHWERLAVDPFFVPITEEQREEYGEEGQGVGAPNVARRLIDGTRARKGLPVAARVVESATKQRTRAKKV